ITVVTDDDEAERRGGIVGAEARFRPEQLAPRPGDVGIDRPRAESVDGDGTRRPACSIDRPPSSAKRPDAERARRRVVRLPHDGGRVAGYELEVWAAGERVRRRHRRHVEAEDGGEPRGATHRDTPN